MSGLVLCLILFALGEIIIQLQKKQ